MKTELLAMAALVGILCVPAFSDDAQTDAAAPKGHFGKMGQERGGGPGQGGNEAAMLSRRLAADNPAKFEELKKLRESNPEAFKEEMGKVAAEYREKAKAQREQMKALADEYKKNPTEENKAKLRAELEKRFDERIKGDEGRLQEMSKKLEESKSKLEKGRQERDSKIDEMLSNILSRGKGKDGGEGKLAAPKPQE